MDNFASSVSMPVFTVTTCFDLVAAHFLQLLFIQATSTPTLGHFVDQDFYLFNLKIVVGKHRQHLYRSVNPRIRSLEAKRADFFIGLFNGIANFNFIYFLKQYQTMAFCNLETNKTALAF